MPLIIARNDVLLEKIQSARKFIAFVKCDLYKTDSEHGISDGDFCFTGTTCTEEMGYPETDDATDDGGAGQACVPFQVTITADAWPNEVSWVVNNTETEELVAKGGNDDLVPGDAYDYPVECINYRKGCYAVSITAIILYFVQLLLYFSMIFRYRCNCSLQSLTLVVMVYAVVRAKGAIQ